MWEEHCRQKLYVRTPRNGRELGVPESCPEAGCLEHRVQAWIRQGLTGPVGGVDFILRILGS